LLPDKKEALHEKANILYLLNRMQEAKEHMEAVLSKFEDNASFLNQLGNVNMHWAIWTVPLNLITVQLKFKQRCLFLKSIKQKSWK